jgi:peptide/nickel transport system permease protein
MTTYIIRRLLLLPITLFAIILVNFVILNLAPGDPSTLANLNATGEATRSATDSGATGENQYLLFREHYGLTLPILFNSWSYIGEKEVKEGLEQLAFSKDELSAHQYHSLRTLWGDRAKFIMPLLIKKATDRTLPLPIRKMAASLFIRGGIRQGEVGATLTPKQRENNRFISKQNIFLASQKITENDQEDVLEEKITHLAEWYALMGGSTAFTKTGPEKIKSFFFETRFCRYISRVITLNFGTLRNDSNRKVIHEVGKRIKYSLTLAVIPLLCTFGLCQIFGMIMAVKQNHWVDYSLNVVFLILFAIPIFVVAPFLIEKFALNKTLPFTNISIPYSGFQSPSEVYESMTSLQRLGDILLHIILPLIAIKYGTLAIQARIARTAFLEVLRQDYIRTALAKGLPKRTILLKHVGRNGAITIVTSLATSLGVVLGGSLIVETIFEINGFGKFFYEAILNRDYNVVLFSAFAGSFLTLIGFLIADLSYTLLDPRISLESTS